MAQVFFLFSFLNGTGADFWFWATQATNFILKNYKKRKKETVISETAHPCKKEVNSNMVMVLRSFSLLHIHNHFPPIHKHNFYGKHLLYKVQTSD